jgi:MFS family permease
MVEGMGSLPQGTVTFLFAEVEGSAPLLEEQRQFLRATFEAGGGVEVDATAQPLVTRLLERWTAIAALAGVAEHEAGLASGLLNTSQQIGGAIGVAIAPTVAATHFDALTRAGATTPAALTGGFQWALWVCGAIGLAATPIAFLLIRRDDLAGSAEAAEEEPALASAA